MSDYREQFTQECKAFVGDYSGLSILIPGCGPGNDCMRFIQAGARVTGLDIGADLGTAYSHPHLQYHRGSIEKCDLPSGRFDLIFCIATMEHVHRIESAFREMIRLVRPGGLVYSVASPLWNSIRGHHIECLNPFPWIHLLQTPAQIVQLGRERGLRHNGMLLDDVMDFLFVSDYFNRAPASRYVAACRDLRVSKMLSNSLWIDGEKELSDSMQAELAARGFSRDELLSTSHTFIARK